MTGDEPEKYLDYSVNANGVFLPAPYRLVGGSSDAFSTRLLYCDPFVEAGHSVATTVIADNFTRSIVMTFRGTANFEDVMTDCGGIAEDVIAPQNYITRHGMVVSVVIAISSFLRLIGKIMSSLE